MNNDRFKFRVWDTKEHKYNYARAAALSPSGELLVEWAIGFICYPNPYIIEQCTGLKDKNGKLIYEGDYIRFPHSTLKGPVRWCECFGAWVVKCKGRREMFFDPGWEIIGNIHEEERKNEN